MSTVNKAILIGNLGVDPEIRELDGGKLVANLSLGTSEKWTDKGSGEKKEKTEWHRCVFYGRLAEVARDYTHKGSKLYVEGKIQTRTYNDKEGVKRYATEINGFNLQMLDKKSDGHSQPVKKTSNNEPFVDDELPSF